MTGRKQWIQSLPITFWLLYIGGLSALSGFWLFYLEGVLEWGRVLPALWSNGLSMYRKRSGTVVSFGGLS
jgi:hypothetical protein